MIYVAVEWGPHPDIDHIINATFKWAAPMPGGAVENQGWTCWAKKENKIESAGMLGDCSLLYAACCRSEHPFGQR